MLLQLWKGVAQNFTGHGTPIFPVTCSGGFFQIMNQYPERQLSRKRWRRSSEFPPATTSTGLGPPPLTSRWEILEMRDLERARTRFWGRCAPVVVAIWSTAAAFAAGSGFSAVLGGSGQ